MRMQKEPGKARGMKPDKRVGRPTKGSGKDKRMTKADLPFGKPAHK